MRSGASTLFCGLMNPIPTCGILLGWAGEANLRACTRPSPPGRPPAGLDHRQPRGYSGQSAICGLTRVLAACPSGIARPLARISGENDAYVLEGVLIAVLGDAASQAEEFCSMARLVHESQFGWRATPAGATHHPPLRPPRVEEAQGPGLAGGRGSLAGGAAPY